MGLASRDAEGTLTSSGAAFALPTVTGDLAQQLGHNPANNQMLGALDPGETLVMCCPRSVCVSPMIAGMTDSMCVSVNLQLHDGRYQCQLRERASAFPHLDGLSQCRLWQQSSYP